MYIIYWKSIRGVVKPVGRATIFCLTRPPWYVHCHLDILACLFLGVRAKGGILGSWDHQKNTIMNSNADQKIIGASNHLKGARCGISRNCFSNLSLTSSYYNLTILPFSKVGDSVSKWLGIYWFNHDRYKWVICSADLRALTIEDSWPVHDKSKLV